MTKAGNILLFPCPITEGKMDSLSTESIDLLHQTTYFIVERAKTARHFIKATKHPIPIAQLHIHEITNQKQENESFLLAVHNGFDVGVISEAGCPGVADPGAEIVDWAHKNRIKVATELKAKLEEFGIKINIKEVSNQQYNTLCNIAV